MCTKIINMPFNLKIAGLLLLLVMLYVAAVHTEKCRVRVLIQKMQEQQRKYETQRAAATKRHRPEIVRQMSALAHGPFAWSSVLQLGDIYNRGSYPAFVPNRDMAVELYHVTSQCPEEAIAREAQTRYVAALHDPIAAEDLAGKALPLGPGRMLLQKASEALLTTSFNEQRQRMELNVEPIAIVTDTRLHTHRHTPLPPKYTDAQNVHDHSVTASLAQRLQHLPEGSGSAYEDVMMMVLESDAENRADAFYTLDSLGDLQHSTLGTSERQALGKVWNRIQQMDPEMQRNAKAMLLSQLASGVEHGNVVCSTGKIARILGTLDGFDVDEPIKPMWAVKEEIASLAAKTRNDGGDAAAFKQAALKTYVDELGLHPKIIGTIVDEYSLGFE